MAKFNLENYETVEERLKKFWTDYPNGRVETEVVHITDNGECVTIKSAIYKDMNDTHPVATGIAQETKGQGGFANADAWMENCETSSLGRSLANWMYQGTDKARPSREEMSKSAPKVQVEKKPVAKPTKEEQDAMNKSVDMMIAPSEEEVARTDDTQEMIKEGKFTGVANQLNTLLTAMIPNESLRKTIKSNAYGELVDNGVASPDVEMWTQKNIDVFMVRAEDMYNKVTDENNKDKDIIEEVFGEIEQKVVRACPECGETDWIEDNREKKASDERFAKIPSWSCSTYQSNNGCGWTAWGDTDCPPEWL